jgi:uridine kinase
MQDVGNFNFDHPSAFDFNEVEACLRKLLAGNDVEIPLYDFKSCSRFDCLHTA